MKKSNRLKAEKIDDKYRLISLTNNNSSLPEHVCKYREYRKSCVNRIKPSGMIK